MDFVIKFSDGNAFYVRKSSPKEAFMFAMKEWGIGRIITHILDEEERLTFYEKGNFIDPFVKARKDAAEIPENELMECLFDYGFNRNFTVSRKGTAFKLRGETEVDKDVCTITISVSLCEKLLRKVSFNLLKVPEVKEEKVVEERTKHTFGKDRVCIHCGKSIFDVEDPTGYCDE